MSAALEFYKFVLAERVFRWTSGDTAVEHEGETYTPEPIGRSGVEDNDDIRRANLRISVPLDNALAQIYLAEIIDRQATVTLFRREADSAETSVYWRGRIAVHSPRGQEMIFECESVFTSLRRPGARKRYQRSCAHVLYHRGCNLDRFDFAAFDVPLETTQEGVVVRVPAAAQQPDGWYLGGMLDLNGSLRFIVQHVGEQLALQRPIEGFDLASDGYGLSYGEFYGRSLDQPDGYGLSYGQYYGHLVVAIHPGCDRLRQTCLDKFDNLDNFGGFPWMPGRNPFDGSAVF